MSFEATIDAALTGSSDLTALLPATSILCGTAQEKQGAPFIVFYRVTTTPTLSTDNGQAGAHRLDNISLEVAVFAKTNKQALQIAEVARNVLEALRPTVCIYDGQDQTYDDFPQLYGQRMTFSCWHPSQIPTPPPPEP